MRIVTVRRISQGFFLALLVWFCLVTTVGERWWQLRGWPVNWLLELDPLAGLATLLSTGTLYRGLLWGLVTVVLTFFLGRVFCGWVCPFGTLHQIVGYLAHRRRKVAERLQLQAFRPAQKIKYVILALLLGATAWGPWTAPSGVAAPTVQTGLLDPIPLVQRSLNLVLMPLAGHAVAAGALAPRYYEGAWLLALVFLGALALNLWIPRFYCRFICPLGALLGLLARFSCWRIGMRVPTCSPCGRCASHCEGACDPMGKVRLHECLMCMNCLHTCRDELVGYRAAPSAAGEIEGPQVSRRGFLFAVGGGLAAVPVARLSRTLGSNWEPGLLRPPGALAEREFLSRCIKCGQCMRVCPTNIIQPALGQGGLEGLWSPVLNFRIGTSGCELNCIACGQVCPTSALRPLELAEKRGQGAYAERGPVRIGLAFIDRNRCLPWAFGKPCIVCQEVCPVSPKAIEVRGPRPFVVADRCIGCGICEHECPVSGLKAIRITAENETRHPGRAMTV